MKNIEFNTQDNQKLILPDVTFQITPYHLDSTVTGLSNDMEENEGKGTIYDISSRNVDFPQKGIIIIDGTKVLIK